MSAESIVSLKVGGTIFQTSPSTMLKYPDSKLARMYNEQKQTFLNEGQKIKNLNFFLDENPEYFQFVLNFLRNGKIIKFEDENLFVGVRDLAKNLELPEIVKLFEKEYGFSTVAFEFVENNFQDFVHAGRPLYYIIARRFLTRVPESHLAKFFFGEQGSQNPLSKWIFKKGPNRYIISNKAGLTQHILKFMEMPTNSEFNTTGSYRYNKPNVDEFWKMLSNMWTRNSSIDFLKELELYGIQEFDHFKKSPGTTNIIWNENYNVN